MESGKAFKFLYPEWREIDPPAWIEWWAARYEGGDNPEYFALIEKRGRLSAEDIELAGRWKEGCLKSKGRWKSGTPVGYDVWMQASQKPPECPPEADVCEFLNEWSKKTFAAGMRNSRVLKQSFGLSRSTALLHFVSGGRYAIFDSRVETAIKRLGYPIEGTAEEYLNSFCPVFSQLASLCGVTGIGGLRKLDTALFAYGADRSFPDSLR